MSGSEKILIGLISILLVIVILLGVQNSQHAVEIGALEYQENEIREAQIKAYDSRINSLSELIVTLQTENDSLRNEKAKIRTVTITEIDSIRALPFGGKRMFWTTEVSRIDSVRKRYLSRD